jgi:hypothetical protein
MQNTGQKTPFGKSWCTWHDNFEMNLRQSDSTVYELSMWTGLNKLGIESIGRLFFVLGVTKVCISHPIYIYIRWKTISY